MLPPILLLSSLMTVAPATAAPSAVDPAAAVEPAPYDESTAADDVETILDARGRDYLEARARLEDNPSLAAAALVARLEAVPAPGPQQNQRILSVLSALHRPEHVHIFAAQLRGALIDGKPSETWKKLLLDQGEAAVDPLFGLVGDKKLTEEQRGEMLDALIDRLPMARIGELTGQVGRGASALEGHLRRGLIRRARGSDSERKAVTDALFAELKNAADDGPRTATLIVYLSSCGGSGQSFVDELATLANDDGRPFVARVAAIHALGRIAPGTPQLGEVARRHATAEARKAQASEVIAWLALEAMEPNEARAIATSLALHRAAQPRLAAYAYEIIDLAPDHSWLAESQAHPWPQVRRAALDRVEGDCSRQTVELLFETASPHPRKGTADPLVGRAAVGALGRCGSEAALDAIADVLGDRELETPLRAAAARQLVQRDVPGGADLIAKLLARSNFPEMSRELAEALASAPEPSKFVWEALCLSLEGDDPQVVPAARSSFRTLYPGRTCDGLYGDDGR